MKRVAIVTLSTMLAFGIIPVRAEENEEEITSKTEKVTETTGVNEDSASADEESQDETEITDDSETVDDSKQTEEVEETPSEEVTDDESQIDSTDNEEASDEAATDESDIATYAANLQVPALVNVSSLTYAVHVQDYGWMNPVTENQVAGTTGQSKRVEAMKISLPNELTSLGDIHVEAHVQDYGWLPSVGNNQIIGTTGQSKRVEALKISLTGELANQYNVVYRTHVQDIGWLGWRRNGALSGTTGQSKRIEAIQIYLQSKADAVPIQNVSKTITYKAHVQDIGWMNGVTNGQTAGTVGQSKRVEAFQVSLNDDMLMYGDISVQAHVQDYGWLSAVGNDEIAGTVGQSKRLEGLKISLTGDLADYYDVYYRSHVGNIGWLGWTKNGELSGSVGCNRRIEAFEIAIYAKGDPNAPKTGNSSTTSVENPQYTPTYYSQRDPRWASSPTYGGYNLQSTGCVPTAIAMAVDGILHNGVTPVTMADYLYYNTSEFSTIKHGGSCLAVKLGAEHWGLKTTPIGTYQDLVNCLNAGNIVVMAVGPGTFTSRGYTHEITMFRNSGGSTYVYDPWNAHNGWYSISMIWSQQSTNSYDLRGGYVAYGIHQ